MSGISSLNTQLIIQSLLPQTLNTFRYLRQKNSLAVLVLKTLFKAYSFTFVSKLAWLQSSFIRKKKKMLTDWKKLEVDSVLTSFGVTNVHRTSGLGRRARPAVSSMLTSASPREATPEPGRSEKSKMQRNLSLGHSLLNAGTEVLTDAVVLTDNGAELKMLLEKVALGKIFWIQSRNFGHMLRGSEFKLINSAQNKLI